MLHEHCAHQSTAVTVNHRAAGAGETVRDRRTTRGAIDRLIALGDVKRKPLANVFDGKVRVHAPDWPVGAFCEA